LAVCFCGPLRQVTPPRVLPGTVLCGVRTFLSAASAAPRPPSQPEVYIIIYLKLFPSKDVWVRDAPVVRRANTLYCRHPQLPQ